MKKLLLAVVLIFPVAARAPLAQRIIHTDPAKYRPSKAVHEGAGQLDYMPLFDYHDLDTNLFFLHRGIIEPKSGIGHHFHNRCEEMFVIFDGDVAGKLHRSRAEDGLEVVEHFLLLGRGHRKVHVQLNGTAGFRRSQRGRSGAGQQCFQTCPALHRCLLVSINTRAFHRLRQA